MKILIVVYQVAGVPSWDKLLTGSVPMGGSEEAVVNVVEVCKRRGYIIDVKEGWQLQGKKLDYDLVVVWRMTDLDQYRDCGKVIAFWSHDFPCTNEFKQLREGDIFLSLSRFHYTTWLPIIATNKGYSVRVIGNGYTPTNTLVHKKNKFRCIYTSSHNRGLWYVVKHFDWIIRRFPKFSLEVYYDRIDKDVDRNSNAGDCSEMYSRFDQLLRDYPDNFSYHGFILQEDIEKVYEEASLFLYPCIYPETFCISLLKAQANGCIPVVCLYGGLKTTITKSGRRWTCDRIEDWLETLMKSLEYIESTNDEQILEDRKKMVSESRNGSSWEDVVSRLTCD